MNNLNKQFTQSNPLIRIYNATIYSFKGLASAYRTEQAFRHDLILFLVNIFCVVYFAHQQAIWFAWLFFCGLFILFSELMNTAIEYIVDRIGLETNELSGMAKDVGSSLVFLALINFVVSWIIFILFK